MAKCLKETKEPAKKTPSSSPPPHPPSKWLFKESFRQCEGPHLSLTLLSNNPAACAQLVTNWPRPFFFHRPYWLGPFRCWWGVIRWSALAHWFPGGGPGLGARFSWPIFTSAIRMKCFYSPSSIFLGDSVVGPSREGRNWKTSRGGCRKGKYH